MRPHLFLDTEWANDVTRELVSLALTDADGSRTFYAERDPLPSVPSTFSSTHVYPLLQRGSSALHDAEFGLALRRYLGEFNNPVILFDALLDRMQLSRAMNGFGRLQPMTLEFDTMLVTRRDVLDRQEEYFCINPVALQRRHHAGVDAEALRWAYMSILSPAT